MGRPKGSKNTSENTPDSAVTNPVVPAAKEAITDKTFNIKSPSPNFNSLNPIKS